MWQVVKYGMPSTFNPAAPIPDEICLPDGRCFDTVSLLSQVSRGENINLQTGRTTGARGFRSRYTPEDREFLARADLETIQARWGVSPESAKTLRYHSRQFLGLSNRFVPQVSSKSNTK